MVLLALAAVAGCDREERAALSETPAPATGHGVIRGRVTFVGPPPAASPLQVTLSPDCARLHPDGIPDESVVVNPDGTLRNVIVYLKGAPRSDGHGRPPVVLDQVACRYVPHVVAVQVGQTLQAKSSDPFLHNVHTMSSDNPAQNLIFPGPGTQDLVFLLPEIFKSRCDVHPWMTAWVGVFDHPYFCVTGADGRFEISGVPAGAYTVVAWQERLGELEQSVTVADDRPASLDFTYKP